MKSSAATHICKCCFKNKQVSSWSLLFGGTLCICDECYKEFNPRIRCFSILGTPCISLFPYDETIKSNLFQFKGCFDFELGDVFLSRAAPYLKALFRGYWIVPAPSFWKKDETRGFNHVEKMFECLNLPQLRAIRKTEDIKQSDLSSKERSTVSSRLEWVDDVDVRGKKILFVDDVYTTGSTARACLKMIKDHRPKALKALVMAKTIFKG